MNPEQSGANPFEVEKEKFGPIKEILGENFTPEKTIELKKDVDQNNEEKGIGNCEAFWTELRNPDTGEVVEGKIYLPKDGKARQVLIVSPGYRGDFALQEGDYADEFVGDNRAVIFLRHNGIRTTGEDMKNYVHCPQKAERAEQNGQRYLGSGEDFNFDKANREVLTALKSLQDMIDGIEKIDILGHSWGGRIGLLSIQELNSEAKTNEAEQKISAKIGNLILMGAWLETRAENIQPHLKYFNSEKKGDYFKNMNGEEIVASAIESGRKLASMEAGDFPPGMRIIGIQSVGDGDVDLQGEYLKFFGQLQDMKKGSIVLKDLLELLPQEIGSRPSQTHDYALPQVRGWIKEAIDK